MAPRSTWPLKARLLTPLSVLSAPENVRASPGILYAIRDVFRHLCNLPVRVEGHAGHGTVSNFLVNDLESGSGSLLILF